MFILHIYGKGSLLRVFFWLSGKVILFFYVLEGNINCESEFVGDSSKVNLKTRPTVSKIIQCVQNSVFESVIKNFHLKFHNSFNVTLWNFPHLNWNIFTTEWPTENAFFNQKQANWYKWPNKNSRHLTYNLI